MGLPAAMLRGELGEMLRHVLERFEANPAFPGFVAWADAAGLPLAVVSDGFGFYVRPMLEMAGLGHVEVRTNELDLSGPRPRLRHRFSHPTFRGCGTCKMLADVEFRERFGPVAFVGDGRSDRYRALYADLVFAKDDLARVCRRDGVPFVPWSTFDDVLRELEAAENMPGPTAPDPCPGWRS
jgi:2-hydroxy-3-keto-5-methylthiopentenyl-1-phosphate phosphatase